MLSIQITATIVIKLAIVSMISCEFILFFFE